MSADAIHPSVSPITAERLRKVAAALDENFQMAYAVKTQDGFCGYMHSLPDKCGTACCIAGEAAYLFRDQIPAEPNELIWSYAVRALELEAYEDDRMNQDDLLFEVDNWPPEFRDAYFATSRRECAAVGRARIEHFIRTGE